MSIFNTRLLSSNHKQIQTNNFFFKLTINQGLKHNNQNNDDCYTNLYKTGHTPQLTKLGFSSLRLYPITLPVSALSQFALQRDKFCLIYVSRITSPLSFFLAQLQLCINQFVVTRLQPHKIFTPHTISGSSITQEHLEGSYATRVNPILYFSP